MTNIYDIDFESMDKNENIISKNSKVYRYIREYKLHNLFDVINSSDADDIFFELSGIFNLLNYQCNGKIPDICVFLDKKVSKKMIDSHLFEQILEQMGFDENERKYITDYANKKNFDIKIIDCFNYLKAGAEYFLPSEESNVDSSNYFTIPFINKLKLYIECYRKLKLESMYSGDAINFLESSSSILENFQQSSEAKLEKDRVDSEIEMLKSKKNGI